MHGNDVMIVDEEEGESAMASASDQREEELQVRPTQTLKLIPLHIDLVTLKGNQIILALTIRNFEKKKTSENNSFRINPI